MEYQCSPVTDGKISVAIGVAGIVLTAVIIATESGLQTWELALLAVADVAMLAWGAYCWKVSRKPFKRQITLGGLSDRLYRRSHWLFAACSFVRCCVEYAVIITLITLLDGGTDFAGAFAERLRGWFFLLPLIMYGTFREYLSYYQYYHTPAGLRRDLFAKTTKTDLYTEAMKQMNDGKEGKQH